MVRRRYQEILNHPLQIRVLGVLSKGMLASLETTNPYISHLLEQHLNLLWGLIVEIPESFDFSGKADFLKGANEWREKLHNSSNLFHALIRRQPTAEEIP